MQVNSTLDGWMSNVYTVSRCLVYFWWILFIYTELMILFQINVGITALGINLENKEFD